MAVTALDVKLCRVNAAFVQLDQQSSQTSMRTGTRTCIASEVVEFISRLRIAVISIFPVPRE